MADLSPAAQAVRDAFFNGPAAALHAAVLNVFYEETLGMTAYGGYQQALDKITFIATELEGGGRKPLQEEDANAANTSRKKSP